MPDWFDDESFWNGLYPFMFAERKFDIAEDEARSILDLVNLGEGDVLDLACGPGRHAVALAKEGFRVTGVDLSPFLLQKAISLARTESVDVEWVRDDMRHFVRPEAFDLVINIFTSFGYFDDKRDDTTVLQNIHRNLRVRRSACHGNHGQGVVGEGIPADHCRGASRRQAARPAA